MVTIEEMERVPDACHMCPLSLRTINDGMVCIFHRVDVMQGFEGRREDCPLREAKK